MKNKEALSLKMKGGILSLIDQQKLPREELWLEVRQPEDMIMMIQELKVRGAPAIGVAGSMALGLRVEQGMSFEDTTRWAHRYREARPTAVNLMNCIDRLLNVPQNEDWRSEFVRTVESIFDEDVQLCEGMSTQGASLIQSGQKVLTHCNTGGLATVGAGTALGVLRKAHEQNKQIHVFVDETRPLLQGGRLTTWECEKLKIPYTLICDNMAASLMQSGEVDHVFVGADRIALNGDFANKIGTYSLAVLCQYHRIPFTVVAPYTTIDINCSSGSEIPIEQRSSEEVKGVFGAFAQLQWAPESSQVWNPAFDVTPADLVTHWVFEDAVYRKEDIAEGVLNHKT